jgi:hypothetical protein
MSGLPPEPPIQRLWREGLSRPRRVEVDLSKRERDELLRWVGRVSAATKPLPPDVQTALLKLHVALTRA